MEGVSSSDRVKNYIQRFKCEPLEPKCLYEELEIYYQLDNARPVLEIISNPSVFRALSFLLFNDVDQWSRIELEIQDALFRKDFDDQKESEFWRVSAQIFDVHITLHIINKDKTVSTKQFPPLSSTPKEIHILQTLSSRNYFPASEEYPGKQAIELT